MSASQSVRFLTFDRRITECWAQLGAAVRAAQAVGLHRDPGKMVSRESIVPNLRYLTPANCRTLTPSRPSIAEGFGEIAATWNI